MAQFVYRARRPIRDFRVIRTGTTAEVESLPAEIDEPAPEEPVAPDYWALLKTDLIALAEELGLDTSGTKADIIARLTDG